MKFRPFALAALLALLPISAYAGNTSLWSTSLGDLIFPFTAPPKNPVGPGSIDNMTIGATTPQPGTFTTIKGQLLGTVGTYSKVAALVAFNYVFGSNQSDMLFEPAGTLSYGYITLGAAPNDGAKECFFSTQIITTLYVAASGGQSINNAVTTLGANARNCYLYSLANTTWDRSQ